MEELNNTQKQDQKLPFDEWEAEEKERESEEKEVKEEWEDIHYNPGDAIIAIKDKSHFFDPDNERLRVIDSLLLKYCELDVEFVSFGEELLLNVRSDYWEDQLGFYFDDYSRKSRIIKNYINKQQQRNITLGCLLIEKFIQVVDPNASVEVRSYKVGRYSDDFDRFKWIYIYKLLPEKKTVEGPSDVIPEEIEKRVDKFLEMTMFNCGDKFQLLQQKQQILANCFHLTWHFPGEENRNKARKRENFYNLKNVPMNEVEAGEHGTLKMQRNLPQTHRSAAALALGKALMSGDFDDFGSMLNDDVAVNVTNDKTVEGRVGVTAYWQEWRTKYVETKMVNLFEVLHSNHYFDACLVMRTMIVLFSMDDDGKVDKMDLLLRQTAGKDNEVIDLLDFPVLQEGEREKSVFTMASSDDICPFGYISENETSIIKVGYDYDHWLKFMEDTITEVTYYDLLEKLNRLSIDEERVTLMAPRGNYHLSPIDPSKRWSRQTQRFKLWWKMEDTDKNLFPLLTVEESEMGIWQLYLLYITKPMLDAESTIDDNEQLTGRKNIYDKKELTSIGALKNYDLSKAEESGLLWPSVTMNKRGDGTTKAHVYCCYWSDWAGLVREHVRVVLRNGHIETIENADNFVIYNYHCDIFF